jgi:hypothetical protein
MENVRKEKVSKLRLQNATVFQELNKPEVFFTLIPVASFPQPVNYCQNCKIVNYKTKVEMLINKLENKS